jgi:hypothetical protein
MNETDPSAKARAPRSGLGVSPWARVDRVQLIRREVREYLAPSALEVLLGHAERQVEGGVEGDRVYATLMVTVDLGRCARFFREPADTATAERVAELMTESPGLERKLVRMVSAELARLAGCAPDDLDVSLEHVVRAEGAVLYVDGDAMGTRRAGRGNRRAEG